MLSLAWTILQNTYLVIIVILCEYSIKWILENIGIFNDVSEYVKHIVSNTVDIIAIAIVILWISHTVYSIVIILVSHFRTH